MTKDNNHQWSTAAYWQGRFESSDTPWQLTTASTVLVEALDELESKGCSLAGKRVMSPGCGRGLDALECARRGAHVLAVDWSPIAVSDLKARYEAQKGSYKGSVEVLSGDFFAIEPNPVDVVIEHTFFCAIDPSMRKAYAEMISQWVKPEGYLGGNFFVLPEDVAKTLPGLSLTQSGEGPPFASTVKELEGSLTSKFEKIALYVAKHPDPERRPGMEWVGIFRRR